jgi:hypothetical protein
MSDLRAPRDAGGAWRPDGEPLRLYSAEEWAAMSEHDRALVAEDRRRAVEHARQEHEARQRLLDSLTVERFGHG